METTDSDQKGTELMSFVNKYHRHSRYSERNTHNTTLMYLLKTVLTLKKRFDMRNSSP